MFKQQQRVFATRGPPYRQTRVSAPLPPNSSAAVVPAADLYANSKPTRTTSCRPLDHPRLLWCAITTTVIAAYYWCAVVVHSWFVGVGVNTLSYAAEQSDGQALLMLGFGALYTGENLAFYYWFGATKYSTNETLKRFFQSRLVLWGISMFFGIALLIVRLNSPTGLHNPFSYTFFTAFMVSWVIAQIQQIIITMWHTPDWEEKKKRISALVIQFCLFGVTLSTGLTFAFGQDTVCTGLCNPWMEYVTGGVGLTFGTFKFLD